MVSLTYFIFFLLYFILTRSGLSHHCILPKLPPFSLDTSAPGAYAVTIDTFWKKLKVSQSGYIGNSVSGKVQVLVPSQN